MTISFVRPSLAALTCIATLFLATTSMAATVNLKGELKASNEIPPNDSKGTGTITATYDSASKKLSWKGTYSGLTGPVTGAHFHGSNPPSPPAANSAIALPAQVSASPFEGSAVLTDEQAADLIAGKWYFNLHTANNKGGEIRGQVTK